MEEVPPNPAREEGHLSPTGNAGQTPTAPLLPPTPPSPSGESHSIWVQQWGIPVGIFLVVAAVLVRLAIALVKLIYPLPYPTRMYLALSAGAAVLVLSGLFFLIIVIPAASRYLKSELRTELYSVRASSLCVIAGLIMFGL